MLTTESNSNVVEREELDPVFKDVLIFCFGGFNIIIQTQVEVSRLPRTMDVLVVIEQTDHLLKIRLVTPFGHFRIHNQIEFKGKNDPLTIHGYHLILGRAHLYLGEKEISVADMTVTIISARKPINVLRHRQDDVKWEDIGEGHYVSSDILPVHLIVINELPIEPKNYPLLLFAASKNKFRQFLERIIKEENSAYIYYAGVSFSSQHLISDENKYRLDPKLTKEVLDMAGKSRTYQKNLEFIAKDIGEELIPFLSKEQMLKHITPEYLVGRLTPEERLLGLTPEELARTLPPEERRKLKQLLDEDEQKNQG